MFVSLRSFLADGYFGGVRIGMTKEEVLALAGEPADFGRGESMQSAEVWLNGKTTFWFSGSKLQRVGVYYVLEYPSNGNLAYDASFPEAGATLKSLCTFMRENQIEFSEEGESSLHQVLVTQAGVQLNAGRDGLLNSIVFPAVAMPGRQGKGDA
jgi:hypothetical protein